VNQHDKVVAKTEESKLIEVYMVGGNRLLQF